MPTAVNFQHGNYIDYTPSSDKSAGDVVHLNGIVGVVATDLAAGQLGALQVEGVVVIAKNTSTAFAVGEAVFWDVADNEANDDTGNPYMGVAVAAAESSDETVKVKLLHAMGDLIGGVFVLSATATAEGATLIETPSVAFRVINAWFYQRGTTDVNVSLLNGANTMTRANVASGTTSNVFKQLEVVLAQRDVAADGTLSVNLSAANTTGCEVHLLCVRI